MASRQSPNEPNMSFEFFCSEQITVMEGSGLDVFVGCVERTKFLWGRQIGAFHAPYVERIPERTELRF